MVWKWKLARDPSEVLHLLNGESRFDHPVPRARVCMTWRGDHPVFWVFATKADAEAGSNDDRGDWVCQVANSPDEALSVLAEADGAVEAQVAAAWTGEGHKFYVFRRPGGEPRGAADEWSWGMASTWADTLRYLNHGADGRPWASARVAGAHRQHHEEFFVFCRGSRVPLRREPWRWHAVGSADDVRNALASKKHAPLDFQVAAPADTAGAFHVFTVPPQDQRAERLPMASGVGFAP
jgi:hypothetical protein